MRAAPRWRELVARAYHNSLYNQCAPHFGKLSEFAKVLSFGASRTGFYATHTLANFQSLTKFYPSVRAAQAFIYLNEQSVLCPVQLRTQCVRNWIHSIELPQNFSCLTEKPLSAKITKKLTIKVFFTSPSIQNSKFKIQNYFTLNSKFKIQNSKFSRC